MSHLDTIEAFIASKGWGKAHRKLLAGDASARRYERLTQDNASCLLMDVPPESGLPTEPFIGIAEWLLREGFSAPEILASDPQQGLVLVEDFGDDLFARLCSENPTDERELYFAAVDVLVGLQKRSPPVGDTWSPPPYDMSILMREAGLLLEWYLPLATGVSTPPELGQEYLQEASRIFSTIPETPKVAVMRDYHAENLIWLPKRENGKKVGLLDFQDMLVGHPAYDLVSLLDDARRDVDPDLRKALMADYLSKSPWNNEEFLGAAHVLSVQRNLKILGLFTRLCRRDGKPGYLAYLPRVWDHLQRNLKHPALSDLAAWINAHVPAPDENVRRALGKTAA